MSADIPEDDDKKHWTVHDHFVYSATLLGGGVVRWKAAVAEKLGISRSYMHHLRSGARPLTEQTVYRLVEVMRVEAFTLRERAAWLETSKDELLEAYDTAAGKEPYVELYAEPVPEEPAPPVEPLGRTAAENEYIDEFLDGLMADEEAKELSAKRKLP